MSDNLCQHERASNGRVSAVQEYRGNSFEEAMAKGLRWFPRIAGENFTPSNREGFKTREEAIADAKQIKERLREYLAAARTSQDKGEPTNG